ncbi:gliding motility protein [Streptomyces sp. NBC_01803]|uniref:gliding motility protein n=1 Tax=Streptomyces sp. NBC_01803 TaxID=2975946 RepID=UPI002DDBA08C|nr:gliding motility protein [Streptomyces sp. NBC_01803]WSA43880.1 gliding motility protein [Streptomyces sp. NBC_01803]
MGVFAWLKGRGQDRKQPSGTAAGEAGAAPEETPAAEGADGDGVGIPKQTAGEAADREAGEEARK